jgi:hypothetical protein
MDKEVNLIADTIVYAVQNQKSQVLGLLLKNGVVVPSGTSDAKIIVAVSDTFKKSKPFRKSFIDLIGKSEYVSSGSFDGYANVNGFEYDKNFNPDPLFSSLQTIVPAKTTTKTDSAKPKASSSSFWSAENIMALINKGADVYTTTTTNQANKALADAATARANAGIVDVTNDTSKDKKDTDTDSNTVTYVVVGLVGVALIGGLIWYFTKAKE